MPEARPVIAGDTNMYTRRCHRREFRLQPCDAVNTTFGYLAGVLSEKHEVNLSAICVEPNHHHTIGQDLTATSPDFTREFHAFSALALNRHFGERDSLWNCQQTSQVVLEEPSDILEKIVYALGNPVKDGLVEHGDEYPGLRVAWPLRLEFERPPFWFDPNAKKPDGSPRWPDRVELVLHRPAGFEELSDDELLVELQNRLRAFEDAARAERRERGLPFLGPDALRATPRHHRATSFEPRGRISPTVAAKNRGRRIARLLFRRNWRVQHKEARVAFASGDRDVVFPYGTYLMRVRFDVNVAAAPT